MMSSQPLSSTQPRPRVHVWRTPVLLGILTCFGLLSALLGSGIWNVFSWIAMAIPLLVGAGFWIFPRNKTRTVQHRRQ
ncbi:hypothetical protein [Neopusillimonas maritima]|nr:hypothetical protein [Neopusillimonas maritima]